MIVARESGTYPSECTLVKQGKGASSCGNVTGTMAEMIKAIESNYVLMGGVNPTIPLFTTIHTTTSGGHGILSRVAWTGGGSVGHIAPVIGNNNDTQKLYITFISEHDAVGSWITYTQYKNGTAGLGGSTYDVTHYTLSK